MPRIAVRGFLALFILSLTTGCNSYSSKFKKVAEKIRQHEYFQSLEAEMDYKFEPGDAESIPFHAIMELEYVDEKTGKTQALRVRYGYQPTFPEGGPREWNWILANVEQRLENGEWQRMPSIVDKPKLLDMLRP